MHATSSKPSTTPIPLKAGGAHFYRYSRFTGEKREWLKEIILEHRLYVPRVDQLNDPADGRPKLVRLTEDQLFSLLYNAPFGVLANKPHLSVEGQIREGVVLDYNIRHHGVDTMMRLMATNLNAKLSEWRIYSLSKRYDNLSMWSNYGGNHTGYCLEFANDGSFFSSAKEVTYGDSVEVDVTNSDQLNGWWFFCKRSEWSNEEEVRILLPRQSEPKQSIEPAWLRRLILGWRMPESDRLCIREWAKQRSPELKVVSAIYDDLSQTLRTDD